MNVLMLVFQQLQTESCENCRSRSNPTIPQSPALGGELNRGIGECKRDLRSTRSIALKVPVRPAQRIDVIGLPDNRLSNSNQRGALLYFTSFSSPTHHFINTNDTCDMGERKRWPAKRRKLPAVSHSTISLEIDDAQPQADYRYRSTPRITFNHRPPLNSTNLSRSPSFCRINISCEVSGVISF